MADMFTFFLEVGSTLFAVLGQLNIFTNLSILDFIIALFVLYLIVDNFIIKPSRSAGSGRAKVSKSNSKNSSKVSKDNKAG